MLISAANFNITRGSSPLIFFLFYLTATDKSFVFLSFSVDKSNSGTKLYGSRFRRLWKDWKQISSYNSIVLDGITKIWSFDHEEVKVNFSTTRYLLYLINFGIKYSVP